MENARSEFPVSSAHYSIKAAHITIREDLEVRWVKIRARTGKDFILPHVEIRG
jgi:hypothetical protein